ncbi:hypothetical protein ACENW9_000819 [Escherichia coli]
MFELLVVLCLMMYLLGGLLMFAFMKASDANIVLIVIAVWPLYMLSVVIELLYIGFVKLIKGGE